MSKLTKTALALVLSGLLICGVCIVFAGFDFSNLSTSEPQTAQLFEYDTNAVEISSIDISLSTDDFSIVESDDELIHIKLYKYDFEDVTAEVKNGVLTLGKERHDYKSLFGVNLNFRDYTNVISLPKSFEGNINAVLSTGDIEISGIESLGHVNISLSTGDTVIKKCGFKSLTVSCSTGDINIENASISENAVFDTSTGDFGVKYISVGGSLTRISTTGMTNIENVSCASVNVGCSTADVFITALDANDITIKTTTGDVSGTVKGAITDYTITSHTTTGDNSLPNSIELGDRRLNVKTSTGDIDIRFE